MLNLEISTNLKKGQHSTLYKNSTYHLKKKNIKNTIFGYENKENFPVNVSKSTFKTRVDLL